MTASVAVAPTAAAPPGTATDGTLGSTVTAGPPAAVATTPSIPDTDRTDGLRTSQRAGTSR